MLDPLLWIEKKTGKTLEQQAVTSPPPPLYPESGACRNEPYPACQDQQVGHL
jgi:hypothetical protein